MYVRVITGLRAVLAKCQSATAHAMNTGNVLHLMYVSVNVDGPELIAIRQNATTRVFLGTVLHLMYVRVITGLWAGLAKCQSATAHARNMGGVLNLMYVSVNVDGPELIAIRQNATTCVFLGTVLHLMYVRVITGIRAVLAKCQSATAHARNMGSVLHLMYVSVKVDGAELIAIKSVMSVGQAETAIGQNATCVFGGSVLHLMYVRAVTGLGAGLAKKVGARRIAKTRSVVMS